MSIDTGFYLRCIQTLETALTHLESGDPESLEYEMFRSACVKEFEIILEQSGKLLRKCLKAWLHSPKAADQLTFKDVFRKAAQHGLIDLEATARWLAYRDNRNNTAHDYGKKFAEITVKLFPQFIDDARELERVLSRHADD